MGNRFYKLLQLKTRCCRCQEWKPKRNTFRDRAGKRYCAACIPVDFFSERLYRDSTPLL